MLVRDVDDGRYYLNAVSECVDVRQSECGMQVEDASNRCTSRWFRYVGEMMMVVRDGGEEREVFM